MKKIVCIVVLIGFQNIFAQSSQNNYSNQIKKSDSLFIAKDYKNAAISYSSAFRLTKVGIYPYDLYHAACAWSKAECPDSVFFNLNQIATLSYFIDKRIMTDLAFSNLHKDKRWRVLVKCIKGKAKENPDKLLSKKLDSILIMDQKYRMRMKKITKKKGNEATKIANLWKRTDSLNLIEVTNILDRYGWLGQETVGKNGSMAFFLIIQHSDLKIQERYFPMLTEAVKNGKADASHVAYLEDRILLANGKNQIYGTQIGGGNNAHFVLPLIDVDNVDSRRAFVGLAPLEEYLKN